MSVLGLLASEIKGVQVFQLLVQVLEIRVPVVA